MKTIAIVGVGSGARHVVGPALGGEGFQVGIIARRRAQLDSFVDELGRDGIRAAAFPADVTRTRGSERCAASCAQRDLDVLWSSPTPGPRTRSLTPRR